jgi:hypothetical protein
MALPASGALAISQISVELGRASTAPSVGQEGLAGLMVLVAVAAIRDTAVMDKVY